MRNNIKRFRLGKKWRLKDLGDAVGVSANMISKWEIGSADPSPAQQQSVAIALDKSATMVFPDFALDVQIPKGFVETSTIAGLRRSANVHVGDRMIVKVVGSTENGSVFRPATVVETGPWFFRVQLDRSGYCQCVHYQAFLTENNVRRMRK